MKLVFCYWSLLVEVEGLCVVRKDSVPWNDEMEVICKYTKPCESTGLVIKAVGKTA